MKNPIKKFVNGQEFETENFKFFQHRECEYFPCHDGVGEDEFNCLFCYCPLYALGEKCGGNFKYLENGCKDCTECIIPHLRESYDVINKEYPKIKEMARKKK